MSFLFYKCKLLFSERVLRAGVVGRRLSPAEGVVKATAGRLDVRGGWNEGETSPFISNSKIINFNSMILSSQNAENIFNFIK